MNVITAQPNPQMSPADNSNPTGDVKCQFCQREVRLIMEPKKEKAFWGAGALACVPMSIYACQISMNSAVPGTGVFPGFTKAIDSIGKGFATGGVVGAGVGIFAGAMTECLIKRWLGGRECTHVQDAPIPDQPQAETSAPAEEQSLDSQAGAREPTIRFVENSARFRGGFLNAIRDQQ
ncbi:hypothetical protein [Endozoicomonas sp. ONNA2]|uniref:hypothetical protein n=1 Tax=Endozoicomonas sp. ONNA2 TaxID=2828741 RepID=UPI002148A1A8|nr:hypothetical protein [Endozoicomonas sp. ONNA2]